MQKINQKYIKIVVQQSLREDLRPSGDITTRIIKNKKVTAKIIAGQHCIVGGLNFAKEAFKISDKKITFKAKTKEVETAKQVAEKTRKEKEEIEKKFEEQTQKMIDGKLYKYNQIWN